MSLSGQVYQLYYVGNNRLEEDLEGKKNPTAFCSWGSATLLKHYKSHYY